LSTPGVKPDIEVEGCIGDYLAGRDVILERALAEIEKINEIRGPDREVISR